MASLLSKLSNTSKVAPIEPREIFMALPQKNKRYEYPRDVQSDVWKKWFVRRNEKNCIIKMNTGSGKTVVGLMILQSCLNEGKGPAVYVVPDKYLVTQVCEEAQKLGILVTEDKDDYSYTENKAILVTTIFSLVNGRSVFGMRQSGNYPIGSILMDDVHACLDTITTQFSLKIPSSHLLYSEITNLFADQWKIYNNSSYVDIVELGDPTKTAIIPFWIWQEKQTELYTILSKYNNDEDENQCIYFNLPLLTESLATSDCFITARGIEIIPEGISISKIKSFESADRRVFMSATLSDDSVFSSAIGLHKDDVQNAIVPDNANDIGDRLILFPKHLNHEITDDEIKERIVNVAQKYNVVVIVPSFDRARYWDSDGSRTIYKENIEKAVQKLKESHIGLVVFVNRYDGIDLPDDACRVLVIDSLPPLKNYKDRYIQSIDSSSNILKREQIQRIEQGMGRGVRSNSDSCCIVLMGDNLADVLLRNNGISFFSNATREQYNLSKDLWNLLKEEKAKPCVADIFELADYSLNREVEWIQNSKERLSSVVYSSETKFDANTTYLRKAYDYTINLQWQKAVDSLNDAINSETNSSTKGFLLQIKAKYTNFIDKSQAQQILLSGRNANTGILYPISGIRYDKAINNKEQAKAICEHIYQNRISQNDYVIYVNAINNSLSFLLESDEFEDAFQKAGQIIGFVSSRPDKETNGEGPDNLWAIGGNKYLVIESKNGAVSDTISKDYCNQLGGSMRWFSNVYGNVYFGVPIMIHKSVIIDRQATAVPNMKIITQENLELLRENINKFAIAVTQDENWCNEMKINQLLCQYKLRGDDIVQNYTTSFRTL